MEHSRLAPSSASRWVVCPGSVSVEEQYADTEQRHGADGAAAHFVADEILKGRACPVVGSSAPNGIILDDAMVKSAGVFVDAVRRRSITHGDLFTENKIFIPWVNRVCFGTVDAWHYNPTDRELHIWDFKYGWLPIEAEKNWQLICYAAGIMYLLKQQGVVLNEIRVVLSIVQPRPYHMLGPIRSWRTNYEELVPLMHQLYRAAEEALNPRPQCISGPQCKYCTGRHACSVARSSGLYFCEFSSNTSPHELPIEALGLEIKLLERGVEAIKLRLAGLEAQAIALLKKGVTVPGLAIAPSKGRREWDLPALEVIAMGDLLGVNLRKEIEPITPTQARDLKIPANVINHLSSIHSKGDQLVSTDKTLAAKVFGPNGVI